MIYCATYLKQRSTQYKVIKKNSSKEKDIVGEQQKNEKVE